MKKKHNNNPELLFAIIFLIFWRSVVVVAQFKIKNFQRTLHHLFLSRKMLTATFDAFFICATALMLKAPSTSFDPQWKIVK